MTIAGRKLRRRAVQLDHFFHQWFGSLRNPLVGDRCVEYAFVVKEILGVDRRRAVLDVGSCASPLTTVIKSLGFEVVHGIDLLPSPVRFDGVTYHTGDFLQTPELRPHYGVVIFCSSVEHFGLAGRYGSPAVPDGDVRAVQKAWELLEPDGLLVMTLPYGIERVVYPYHRVYNKESALLKYLISRLQLISEEYYCNGTDNVWQRCTEEVARTVEPSSDNYALGLFVFLK